MSAKKWLTVRAESDQHHMVIDGPIGKSWWDDSGTSSKEFSNELSKIPEGKKIIVHVNSEGGSIQDGLGIYNAIKARSKDVTCCVDGYAVSIASVIPLAASRVISPKSSIWMMHKPWSVTQGNDDDHLQSAEMLKQHGEMMAAIYSERTGKSKRACMDAMKKETWFTGEEAVDWGLADDIGDDDDSKAKWDATIFASGNLDVAGRCVAVPERILAAVKQWGSSNNPPRSDDQGQGQPPQAATISANPAEQPVGIAADTTREESKRMPENAQVAAANPSAEVEALRAQYLNEKRIRIKDKVTRLAENKIENARLEWWVNQAMNDEEGACAQIAAMPTQSPGGTPVGSSIEITAEGAVDVIKKNHKTAGARYAAMVDDWNNVMIDACKRDVRSGIIKDELFVSLARAGVNPFSVPRIQFPVATNTITSVLTNFLMDGSVTNLQNRWAMLRAFSLDTRPDGYKPLAPGVLKHVTVGSTAQTNPTNYESGDSTVAPVTITPAEHSVSYQISNTDLNSGVRMQDLVTINTANFANAVIEAATTPITTTNYTGSATVQPATAFSFSDLATLQALLKKSPIKNLIIDGAWIARIANTPGFFQTAGVVGGSPQAWRAFGWDGIYQNTDWTGAGTNIVGFACHPQALGGIIGLPLLPAIIPGNILASNVMTVEGLDIQVLAEAWFNPASRTSWNSLRVMDGWNAVDTTAGFVLKSA